MLTARTNLPLSELASVRRALSVLPLGACTDRCCSIAAPASRRMEVVPHASRHEEASPSRRPSAGGKGFGAPVRPSTATKQPQTRRDKVFEEDPEASEEDSKDFAARPEYQMYTDDQFMPKRFIGDVHAATTEGKGRTLVATAEVNAGDLVMLLPALAFLEGEMFQAPEPEDLHVSMLEDGLTAAQRHVLDLMDTASVAHQQASVTTLDAKFWASRGSSDPSAPAIDSKRLLRIITQNCYLDAQQDTAVMQMRQQAPNGFIGLWPEASLMAHSCVPNTSLTVIGDRMLLHAADLVKPGELLTRNCIGAVVTQPLAARQAAVMEARGYKCNCPRCVTEEGVSEGMRQMLEEAVGWYSDEALPQWNLCQEEEDMEALKALYEETELIVFEVEEALEGEAGLSEDQVMWLRTSAYDCYDLLVMCDEFVNQDSSTVGYLRACLEIITTFAPGSESHTNVALKYDGLARTRADLAEYVAAKKLEGKAGGPAKRGRLDVGKRRISPEAAKSVREAKELRSAADQATQMLLHALYTRYGLVSLKQLGMLKEGIDMYNDALEQMSVMQAQGQTEMSTDYMIDGVKFTLTDKLGGMSNSKAQGEEGEGYEVSHEDGVQVMYMEAEDGGVGEEEEEGEVVDVEAETVVSRPGVAVHGSRAKGAGSTSRRRQGGAPKQR